MSIKQELRRVGEVIRPSLLAGMNAASEKTRQLRTNLKESLWGRDSQPEMVYISVGNPGSHDSGQKRVPFRQNSRVSPCDVPLRQRSRCGRCADGAEDALPADGRVSELSHLRFALDGGNVCGSQTRHHTGAGNQNGSGRGRILCGLSAPVFPAHTAAGILTCQQKDGEYGKYHKHYNGRFASNERSGGADSARLWW